MFVRVLDNPLRTILYLALTNSQWTHDLNRTVRPGCMNVLRYVSQKMKFSLRISSVNVTKSAVTCGFGHIY